MTHRLPLIACAAILLVTTACSDRGSSTPDSAEAAGASTAGAQAPAATEAGEAASAPDAPAGDAAAATLEDTFVWTVSGGSLAEPITIRVPLGPTAATITSSGASLNVMLAEPAMSSNGRAYVPRFTFRTDDIEPGTHELGTYRFQLDLDEVEGMNGGISLRPESGSLTVTRRGGGVMTGSLQTTARATQGNANPADWQVSGTFHTTYRTTFVD